MVLSAFFIVTLFSALLLKQAKNYLFVLSFFCLSVILINSDMIISGFDLGLMSSDDARYYANRSYYDFTDIRVWLFVKNFGYYILNWLADGYIPYLEILHIKLINVISFSFASWLYIYSSTPPAYRTQSNIIFIVLALVTFPLLVVLSVNYKDSILFSCALVIFSIVKLPMNSRLLKIVLVLPILILVESLRLGGSVVIVGGLIGALMLGKDKPSSQNISTIKISIVFVLCFIVCMPLVEIFITEVLGRSIESYRNIFSYRGNTIFGLASLDSLITGLPRSIFQFNPITAYNFLGSRIGEHGYYTYLFVLLYSLFVVIWPFMIGVFLYTANRMQIKDTELLFFVLTYLCIYSYIYFGLIGFRLSFPMYAAVVIYIAIYFPQKIVTKGFRLTRYE